jgi:hypothetical protein
MLSFQTIFLTQHGVPDKKWRTKIMLPSLIVGCLSTGPGISFGGFNIYYLPIMT